MQISQKKYTIKPNGQLHEDVELEIEYYRFLYECGVDEGLITEDEAEMLREYVEMLDDILRLSLTQGVSGEEIGRLKEVSAARALRKDLKKPMIDRFKEAKTKASDKNDGQGQTENNEQIMEER